MEEREKPLMSEGEFIKNFPLSNFQAVGRFKSVRRAFRRGHVSISGIIYPNRPYNNRKHTRGRQLNISKKSIYGNLN